MPSRRAGNFTLHVFPSRAPAGKEMGSTEPSGKQGGWAGISQPFPARSGPLISTSHHTWGSRTDSFPRTSRSCRPLQRGKLGLEWCGDEGGEQGYDRSCLGVCGGGGWSRKAAPEEQWHTGPGPWCPWLPRSPQGSGLGTFRYPCSDPEAWSSPRKHLPISWKGSCCLALCSCPQVLSQPQNRDSGPQVVPGNSSSEACAVTRLCRGIGPWGLALRPHPAAQKDPWPRCHLCVQPGPSHGGHVQ